MSLVHRVIDSPELLLKGAKDPALAPLVLNRVYHQTRNGYEYNRDGVDVIDDEDWDNLIILDACRYDEYEELTPFEGDVETRTSRGSSSSQFVYGNFNGKRRHDLVYVSGNRWYPQLKETGNLDAEVHAHHDVERDAMGGYVPSPEQMTKAALDMASEFPNKRLLIHYMQPHKPYLGDHAEAFRYEVEADYGLREVMRAFDIDREKLRPAYRGNLSLVFEHVQRLVEELDGKTVISSDHGEMLGDRLSPIPVRWYGHPSRVYVPELTEVPWQVVSDGPRREITSDPPVSRDTEYDAEALAESLRNLGYKV